MPVRIEVAYLLIALVGLVAAYALYRLSLRFKEQRRVQRGHRPRPLKSSLRRD